MFFSERFVHFLLGEGDEFGLLGHDAVFLVFEEAGAGLFEVGEVLDVYVFHPFHVEISEEFGVVCVAEEQARGFGNQLRGLLCVVEQHGFLRFDGIGHFDRIY
jgi:hypothetical protein